MNLPNLLSIFRLFVTSIFILFIIQEKFRLALYLFIAQGVSDLLDGFLARIMGKKTDLGAFLDPLADKVMLVSSFVVLYLKGIVPLWTMNVVLLRDFIIGSGFLLLYTLSYRIKPQPVLLGKIATLFQICTIIYVLGSSERVYDTFFFFGTVCFTMASGIHYVLKGISAVMKRETA